MWGPAILSTRQDSRKTPGIAVKYFGVFRNQTSRALLSRFIDLGLVIMMSRHRMSDGHPQEEGGEDLAEVAVSTWAQGEVYGQQMSHF